LCFIRLKQGWMSFSPSQACICGALHSCFSNSNTSNRPNQKTYIFYDVSILVLVTELNIHMYLWRIQKYISVYVVAVSFVDSELKMAVTFEGCWNVYFWLLHIIHMDRHSFTRYVICFMKESESLLNLNRTGENR
jgi:hypothetical protein